jgi:hypothetical protein
MHEAGRPEADAAHCARDVYSQFHWRPSMVASCIQTGYLGSKVCACVGGIVRNVAVANTIQITLRIPKLRLPVAR